MSGAWGAVQAEGLTWALGTERGGLEWAGPRDPVPSEGRLAVPRAGREELAAPGVGAGSEGRVAPSRGTRRGHRRAGSGRDWGEVAGPRRGGT